MSGFSLRLGRRAGLYKMLQSVSLFSQYAFYSGRNVFKATGNEPTHTVGEF